MTPHKLIISATALLVCAFSAPAQQTLQQEITVEHEVVPERRDVNRLDFLPSVNLPAITATPLSYSSRNVQVTVPGNFNTLQPAAYADTLAVSPYRGYAALGLFPLSNLGATIGYKLVDNDHTRLAAFMQYNGLLYKGHVCVPEGQRQYVRNNTGLLNITLHQAVGKKSFIDAGAELELTHYNMPGQNLSMAPQNMRRFNAVATWLSTSRKLDYEISLRYGNFGFNNTILTDYTPRNDVRPVSENNLQLILKGRKSLGHYSTLGAEVDFSYISNSDHSSLSYSQPLDEYTITPLGTYSHALLRLYPYYRFDISKFRLDLGTRVDFTFHSGKAIHIAPRALASWKPSKMLTVFANMEGGEHQNTLRDLYGVTPYAQTFLAYSNSHIPLTVNGGITLGTIRGFYAKVVAGYARANDWLMPVTIGSACLTVFKPVNISGMYWRAETGYQNRFLELSASYQATSQGYNKGYYFWRDRAKGELEGKLKVTPIKPLDISLAYTMRHGRAMINRETVFDDNQTTTTTTIFQSLGSMHNLNLGGTYRFSNRITFFATFNNILNRRYYLPGMVEAQGINGLFGATYKF